MVNSKNVTFNSGVPGAVTRSVHSKLNDIVSVKDFGAVGDGNHDDSDAFQKAVDAFHSNSFGSVWGDGRLYIPKGRYRISKSIISKKESNRFLNIVQNLKKLKSGQLNKLNIEVKKTQVKRNLKKAIF